jgi:hypothetical protein
MLRSVWIRGLFFLAVLAFAGHYGRPWELGWLRPHEAEDIAEDFLLRQNAELDKYTLIRATEYRRTGAWNRLEQSTVEAGEPAVGYVLRYFAHGTTDSWTVGVSPAGQIYRVAREQFEDQPGAELDRYSALNLTEGKMAADLRLPIDLLTLYQDSLYARSQRYDWGFVFAVSDPLPRPRLRVELSGDALTGLSVLETPRGNQLKTLPHRAESDRILGFAIILIGVFIMWQFHKAPLATSAAGVWGGAVFLLILLVRGLTFMQSVLLMPTDVPYSGYLARIGLSAIVDALQAAIITGLIVATGDSAMRDHVLRSTTLTRLGSGLRSWSHAWGNAARWALAAAGLMIIVEIAAMRIFGLVGIYSKLPPIIAGSLSSPLPALALPVQLGYDVMWDEGLYRLWLLPFTMLFLRPWLGVIVSAGLVTCWTGFNPSQFAEPGCLAFLLWNIVAGFLVLRSGILAAILFHLFLLTGLAAITVYWIGFDGAAVGILLGILITVIILIGWREARDERTIIIPYLSPPAPSPEP